MAERRRESSPVERPRHNGHEEEPVRGEKPDFSLKDASLHSSLKESHWPFLRAHCYVTPQGCWVNPSSSLLWGGTEAAPTLQVPPDGRWGQEVH